MEGNLRLGLIASGVLIVAAAACGDDDGPPVLPRCTDPNLCPNVFCEVDEDLQSMAGVSLQNALCAFAGGFPSENTDDAIEVLGRLVPTADGVIEYNIRVLEPNTAAIAPETWMGGLMASAEFEQRIGARLSGQYSNCAADAAYDRHVENAITTQIELLRRIYPLLTDFSPVIGRPGAGFDVCCDPVARTATERCAGKGVIVGVVEASFSQTMEATRSENASASARCSFGTGSASASATVMENSSRSITITSSGWNMFVSLPAAQVCDIFSPPAQ